MGLLVRNPTHLLCRRTYCFEHCVCSTNSRFDYSVVERRKNKGTVVVVTGSFDNVDIQLSDLYFFTADKS